jgi:hypothetical protein
MKVARLCLIAAVFFASATFAGHILRARHWGSNGIELDVRGIFSSIDFDCAHGTITDRFVVDRQGRFDLSGTYVLDGPGPINHPPQPAHYVGDVQGDTMRLTVILVDTGEMIGPFLLMRGNQGLVVKCL